MELKGNVPEKRSPAAPLKSESLTKSGGRFGRKAARAEYTRRKLHRVTPEALASGEVESKLARRGRTAPQSAPARHTDLVEYLVRHGWTQKRSEARRWLRQGKVNVNGKVWAYPHFPTKDFGHDDRGLPRIMVEGQPDPRSLT